jgi:hypothetical protein
VAFTFKLDQTDGTPADPPTVVLGVYVWKPGDQIPPVNSRAGRVPLGPAPAWSSGFRSAWVVSGRLRWAKVWAKVDAPRMRHSVPPPIKGGPATLRRGCDDRGPLSPPAAPRADQEVAIATLVRPLRRAPGAPRPASTTYVLTGLRFVPDAPSS